MNTLNNSITNKLNNSITHKLTNSQTQNMNYRIGFGYDVHRLVEGRELWLGGIRIDHTVGLLGHSDADVLIHAICDALLGAANMRDIGFHFPLRYVPSSQNSIPTYPPCSNVWPN